MPKVVIAHAVEDVERWLQGHAGRAETIAAASVTNLTDYVAADGSNNVAVTADASDPDKLKSALASPSPDILTAEQEYGMVQPIRVYIQA